MNHALEFFQSVGGGFDFVLLEELSGGHARGGVRGEDEGDRFRERRKTHV